MNLMRLSEARKSQKLNGGLPSDVAGPSSPKSFPASSQASNAQESVKLNINAVVTIKDTETDQRNGEHDGVA